MSSVSAYDSGAVTDLGSDQFRKTQTYTRMVCTWCNVAEHIMSRSEGAVGETGGVFTRFSHIQLADVNIIPGSNTSTPPTIVASIAFDTEVNGSLIVWEASIFGVPVSYNGKCEGDVVP